MMEQTTQLTGEVFSSPLLGKVYDQFCLRYAQGLALQPGSLEDLTPDEMSHITGISQRLHGPVNETALKDCVNTILMEHQSSAVSPEDDLMKLWEQMKERKGSKS